ncbi:membrane dipeptidase, partial [Xanthomonas citri pv. mangiferaeindicae]|uniref:membrane dipeptidase n=1 Tax=Xanthomonas citri TaxID=346 RepID=UPI003F7EA8ED
VGIGTDFTQDMSSADMAYFLHYKGYGRSLLTPKGAVFPEQFSRIEQYPNLTTAMLRRGWSEGRIARILGENWTRLFGEVWN